MHKMSLEEHFVIDRLPELSPIVATVGLTGHDFRFTSVPGEALAQSALDGQTPHPVEFPTPIRFA